MNKFLSNIYNKKGKRVKGILYTSDAVISILSIILIPNKFLSILFVVGIFLINIINIHVLDKTRIKTLFNTRTKTIFFAFLFIFAAIPFLVGMIVEKGDFLELAFGNLLPNLLGASIVYSFMDHMSKFNYNNFVIKILQTDYVIGSIIKIFYYFCFFNSTNFFLNENWKYTSHINNVYLFVVIIAGLVVGCSFFYRIFIDDTPFDFCPKEVYPTKTLWCGAAFLISCSLPSYWLAVNIEPILLILNTITAFIVALALLNVVIRKSDKSSGEYPFIEFGVFSVVIILNCSIYVVRNVEDIGDILHQFTTGGSILLAVILGLYILNKKARKQDHGKKR